MEWKNYILSDPEILMGKPCIKGTRISIEFIVSLYEKGWTEKMILENYSSLTEESLRAVFSFLNDCLQNEFYFQIKKSA